MINHQPTKNALLTPGSSLDVMVLCTPMKREICRNNSRVRFRRSYLLWSCCWMAIHFIAFWPEGHGCNVLFYSDICIFVIVLMDERSHFRVMYHTPCKVQKDYGDNKETGKVPVCTYQSIKVNSELGFLSNTLATEQLINTWQQSCKG